ncbi:hypothetical protein ABH920_004361 [Catenulispora sp. EB89]
MRLRRHVHNATTTRPEDTVRPSGSSTSTGPSIRTGPSVLTVTRVAGSGDASAIAITSPARMTVIQNRKHTG